MSTMPPGYLICTTPRSGSTYLCQLLATTGKLGKPTEYFNQSLMRRWDPAYAGDLPSQVQFLLTRSAKANGLRAGKVFWFDFARLRQEKLLHHFLGFRAIYLDRADKLAQAISISRALQSGKFASTMPRSEGALAYSYNDIRTHLEGLIAADRNWRTYFGKAGITPIECRYETLAADPQREIDRIAAALGVGGDVPIDRSRVTLQVQRDGISAEWRERFIEDTQKAEPELLELFMGRPS